MTCAILPQAAAGGHPGRQSDQELNFHRMCVILCNIQISGLCKGSIVRAMGITIPPNEVILGASDENDFGHSESDYQSQYARTEKRLRLLADSAL